MSTKPSRPLPLAAAAYPRVERPLVAIVVPVLNEQDSVGLFVKETRAVLEGQDLDFEIVFVNDGSRDETLAHILEIIEGDERIRVVNLARNFGKEIALSAGIDYARGDVIVPMDVDLQDPPELIPQFIEWWRKGYDVVYGVRTSRKQDTFAKRVMASMFYRVFNWLSGMHIPENAGDFRLIDRRVADVLRHMPERNRFMKGLFAWVGFRAVGVPYERPPRAAGKTKWSQWKLWNFALDGLVGFSTVPLRVWTYIGAAIAVLAFTYGSFIVIRTLLLGIDLPGYASLLTTVLFLGGVQLLSIGVLGEYLGRLFTEVKGRPLYIVDSIHPPMRSNAYAAPPEV